MSLICDASKHLLGGNNSNKEQKPNMILYCLSVGDEDQREETIIEYVCYYIVLYGHTVRYVH